MTPDVVFYISGHGFGHASREVEIINALGRTRPDLRIIIRSAVSPGLLARTHHCPLRARGRAPATAASSSRRASRMTTRRPCEAAIEFFGAWTSRVEAEMRDARAAVVLA